MGVYKYLKEIWKKPKGDAYKERLIQWRKEPVTLRVERPTRLDRARSLGYKAKQGIFVVRQSVIRGSHTRPHDQGGRRTKTQRRHLALRKSYQVIAEERAARKFTNCNVLNSYWVGEDGQTVWYEVIMVDGNHPRIQTDKSLSWSSREQGRVFRGKTSAGKKSRGMAHKGKGFEKARPSRRAHDRKI